MFCAISQFYIKNKNKNKQYKHPEANFTYGTQNISTKLHPSDELKKKQQQQQQLWRRKTFTDPNFHIPSLQN